MNYYFEGKPITEFELYKMYCDVLNECYNNCRIAGFEYETSYALQSIDPVAFGCGFDDWLDSLRTDGQLTERNDDDNI